MPNSVHHQELTLQTQGFTDIHDITEAVTQEVADSGINEGLAVVFVPGSTAAITTIEYEPGLLQDLPQFFEKIIPQEVSYNHDKTWGDGNGYAHLRAALVGPSITVPVAGSRLTLGTWQQIVLIDFDNRARQRRLIVQILGHE